MGVVINHPAEKTIRDVWEMIGNDPVERDELVYIGGPVPGPLVAVHTQRQRAARVEIYPIETGGPRGA